MPTPRTSALIAKASLGECAYSGCHEQAVDGEHCGRHAAHERARGAARQRRRRTRLLATERCLDCGRPLVSRGLRRCPECRAAQVGRVTGDGNRVTGVDVDGAISSIRPGSASTLLITVEVPRSLLLSAVEVDVEPAPCGHRVCARDDGRSFCVIEAIRNANHLPQLDGAAPADRGARNGNEYALTVEQIAQLVGVSTRAIEQSLASALRKLADTKAGEYLRRLIGD